MRAAVLLLCGALLADGSVAPRTEYLQPPSQAITVLDLLTAVSSRLQQLADRLSELQQQQAALAGRLDRLDRLRDRLPEYPVCETVTVESGHQFRLVGDAGCSRGRLQWKIRGYAQWYQLCDRTAWTAEDAAVACRTLGFDTGEPGVADELVGSAAEGHARGLGIDCEGSEQDLWQCEREGDTRHADGCPPDTTPVTVTCSGG